MSNINIFYKKKYDLLIQKAKSEKRGLVRDSEFYNIHHIIPRSLKGKDDKENLIKLTHEEHFLAHKYLYYMYKDSDNINAKVKMSLAWLMMQSTRDGCIVDQPTRVELIKVAMSARSIPVTINGIKYKSISHASRKTKYTYDTIRDRIKETNSLELTDDVLRSRRQHKEIFLDKIRYESIIDVERATEFTTNQIRSAIQKLKTNHITSKFLKEISCKKEVIFNNKTYKSVREAREDCNLTYFEFSKRYEAEKKRKGNCN